ncbi:TlpA family protein disulfide reductase [Cognatiluteimonas weifangensis]|uniref:TlpA family protein disulfide reductase n=1 Tax=Cognatiluteimonas weifangensis TaxID=2303539 RepID=A0A372DIJ3_9GAMM|nr:TlpA disulfide reductase family protein [Luteimonas weifangensis]RFP59356.1 TlpA family protein disulfide reductase [Luteimonas weifangensis]
MNRLLCLACVAALAVAACKPAGDAAAPAAAPPAAAPAPAPAAPAAEVPPAAALPQQPTLQVATLDGKPYDLAAHRGNWVVVNFWATWCGPCLKEMPELSALDAMREHVEVIGLAYEEIEPAELQAFLRKHPVVYPVAIIDVYDPPKDFATPRGLPTTYLIAPDGSIARHFLGPVTAADIDAAIAAAGGPQAG